MSQTINRRQFVAVAAAGIALTVLNNFSDAQTTLPSVLDAGPISNYSKDGVFDAFAASNKVLIYRAGNKVFASSASCTHRGATVQVVNGQIHCPKHGANYDNTGKPVSGPAKVPLFRHPVSIDAKQHLIVDRSKQLGEKQWNDANASVKV